jgi:hypothetical protein
MPYESQLDIISRDSTAVIADANELVAAFFDDNVD